MINKIVVAAFLGVFATSAYAEPHAHAGDVDSVFEDGVIAVETGIAFNYGLDEEAYELSVDALGISEVPVPAAWLFLASGLGALVLGRRAKA